MAYILSDQCNIPVRVSVFSGLDKSAPLFSVKEFGNTCILYSMDKILEYGDTINIIQADERGRVSERKDIPLFDYEAFHEAILNAFVHNKWLTLNATQIQEMMNSTEKCVTFRVSPWVNDHDTIPAVTGTATENGTVTVTKATVLSPECVATVKTQSGIIVETYPIKFIFNTPSDAPTLNSLTVNGTTYTGNNIELNDIPRSGAIKLNFNRPMKATNFTYENASGTVSSSTAIGK